MATTVKYIVEGTGDPHQDATSIDIVDSGSYYTGTTVETALQEVGASIGSIVITDASIETTDIVTNNASTEKHGWFPKLPTASGLFLKDDLTWAEASGTSTFIELTDAPASYSGQAGKVVMVKSTADGLEFGTASGGDFNVDGGASDTNYGEISAIDGGTA